MRILFITDNFPPEVNAPSRRTYEHCVEWVTSGVDVTVITCWPNFPNGRVFDGYKNRFYGRTDTDGIKVIRLWSYMSRNKGFVLRIMDYLSFAFMAFWVGLFQRADVIVATSPQFFTTFSAFGISFLRRKPWIFELRDIWPESIQAVGAMRKGRSYRILERIELFLYRHSSQVLALTPAFRTKLIERGIAPDKISVVPNGVDLSFFVERPKDQSILDQLNLSDNFVIGYIGTHGLAHGLDFIIRSAKKVADPRVHFLLVGDGAEKADLIELAANEQIGNVTFVDSVSKDEIVNYLSIIDVALVPLRRSDTFKSVIPSKIFESCAMTRPILLGVDGQAREIIERYSAGLFFEPENEADFLAQLYILATDTVVYREFQVGCKKLAADYDRQTLAHDALQVIVDATNSSY